MEGDNTLCGLRCVRPCEDPGGTYYNYVANVEYNIAFDLTTCTLFRGPVNCLTCTLAAFSLCSYLRHCTKSSSCSRTGLSASVELEGVVWL